MEPYLTPVFISYPTSDLTGTPIGFCLQNTPRTWPGHVSLPHTWAWLVSTSTVSPLGFPCRAFVSTLAISSHLKEHLLRPVERGSLQNPLQSSGSGPSDIFTHNFFLNIKSAKASTLSCYWLRCELSPHLFSLLICLLIVFEWPREFGASDTVRGIGFALLFGGVYFCAIQ